MRYFLIFSFALGLGFSLGLNSRYSSNTYPEPQPELVKRLIEYREHSAEYCFYAASKEVSQFFCGAFNALDYVLKNEIGQYGDEEQ